jgi:hypothetical protein
VTGTYSDLFRPCIEEIDEGAGLGIELHDKVHRTWQSTETPTRQSSVGSSELEDWTHFSQYSSAALLPKIAHAASVSIV